MGVTPYEGIRVLDFTIAEQGPIGTQFLGDFGAEVIRIERPSDGGSGGGMNGISGYSPFHAACYRNKKSIALNLKSEEGKKIVYDLVKVSDVVASNFRPGVMERLGFGYEDLSRINSRIICAYASGYGQKGPYRDKRGQDLAGQAMSGVISMIGYQNALPSAAGFFLLDYFGGVFLAMGVMAALAAREKTGKGQVVDTSLLNTGVVADITNKTEFLNNGKLFPPSRRGAADRPGHPLYAIYRTKDNKYMVLITAFVPNGLEKTCRALGLPMELASEKRFEKMVKVTQEDHDELYGMIAEKIAELPREEALARLEETGMFAAPVNNHQEVFEDPQVKFNEMELQIEHPKAGPMKVVGFPIKLSGTPCTIARAAPVVGEHNEEIFESLLGMDQQQIRQLYESGVTNQHSCMKEQ